MGKLLHIVERESEVSIDGQKSEEKNQRCCLTMKIERNLCFGWSDGRIAGRFQRQGTANMLFA